MALYDAAPVLLLDRDGTLIEEKHYLSDPEQVVLLPGVGPCLQELAAQGARFFLVSNQSGIGRGYFSPEAAHAVNERLALLLREYNVRFTDMIFCPHTPQEACPCRKPRIGMWEYLQKTHSLDPAACIMVGDKREDMGFAATAGLALRILVLTGHGREAAAALGLALHDESCLVCNAEAHSPMYPQLVIPSFFQLKHGLELFTMSQRQSCGV